MYDSEKHFLMHSLENAARTTNGQYFVEIGVMGCYTAQLILLCLKKLCVNTTYIGIDNDANCQIAWNGRIAPLRLPKDLNAEFHHGLSWDTQTYKPKTVRWCFVDGCHCAECVRKDIAAWAPKIARNGLLLFHDTAFWLNLKRERPHPATKSEVGVLRAIMDSEVELSDFEIEAVLPGDQRGESFGMMLFRRQR